MVNLTATLCTLITANHILHYHNVLDAMGHISVRNPANNQTFFLARQLGPAVVSSPDDIGEYFVANGSSVDGTEGGYAERFIHSEILLQYSDINSVVHSHSEDILPYTVLNSIELEPLYHMAGFLGENIPTFDIETAYKPNDPRDMLVNTPRLGAALAEVLGINTTQRTSPIHTIALQRGHGFITVATSVEQATDYAYYAQSNAKVQTKALLMNAATAGSGVQYLNSAERKDCKNMNAWIAFKPWKQWVREVERDPTYTNTLGSPPGA